MPRRNVDDASLSKMLADLDFDIVEPNAPGLHIVVDGMPTSVHEAGDGALSMLCCLRSEEHGWDLPAVNALNRRMRFGKISVDGVNLVLAADFVVDLASRRAVDDLQQIVGLWRMCLYTVRSVIDDLVPA